MSKHTPGPWRVAFLDRNGQSVIMGEHIELATCWHHSVGAIEREMHANARLIAAAPDLLSLLIRYRNETPLGNQPHMIAEEADKVIAKATGGESK